MNDTSNNKYSSAKVNKIRKEGDTTFFTGKANIFDRFATNKMITLHIKIESHYITKEKKTVLLFKFSPKEFKHKTWKMLEKVKLLSNKYD